VFVTHPMYGIWKVEGRRLTIDSIGFPSFLRSQFKREGVYKSDEFFAFFIGEKILGEGEVAIILNANERINV